MSITISKTTKKAHPRLPYEEIKDKIMGKKYELSLVFIGATRAQSLNQQYRNKSYTPNVLSFPLDEAAGEIFICPVVAAKEAAKFDLSPRGYIGFLLIHGLLHLKGYAHGDTMDRLERRYVTMFKLT